MLLRSKLYLCFAFVAIFTLDVCLIFLETGVLATLGLKTTLSSQCWDNGCKLPGSACTDLCKLNDMFCVAHGSWRVIGCL